MKKVLSIVSALVLSACVNTPEKVQVAENVSLVGFAEVKALPNDFQGQVARWGGVIAKVENQEKQTMIEVVNFDLASSTRPKQKQETKGRFRIYYQGLLDPIIYKVGKSITAVGQVGIAEDGKIGEHKYQYPILNSAQVHLWKGITKVDVHFMQQPYWNSPRINYSPYHRYNRIIGTGYHSQNINKNQVSTKKSSSSNSVNKTRSKIK